MSFRSLCDRLVTIRPMNVTGQDARNNETRGPGPLIEGVPARRYVGGGAAFSANERTRDRDQQTWEFIYDLALTTDDGDPVTVTGRDQIIDGDELFEVDGPPDVVSGHSAPHHIEVRTVRIEG